jgi:adenine-specific DNA methylase
MKHRRVDPHTEDIISKLSQDESGKRQYYRPVYSLHKWWARRPGALFRSILLLASQESKTLFNESDNPSGFIRSHYFQNHDLSDVIIFDPFMGGGTTLVEANRLSAKVIGCDINPVSYWIVRESLKPLDITKLDTYFHQIEQTAGEKIKSLYRTECSQCGISQGESIYVFWIRYVNCLHCGRECDLFKRTLLNEGVSRNKPVSRSNPAIAFCPNCYTLNEWYGKSDCVCKRCELKFDPRTETYTDGYYNCKHCEHPKISLLETLRTGQHLRERLVAIEYWCEKCKRRLYKAPDADDLSKIERIEKEFNEKKDQLILSRQPILPGASSVRWRQHNYRSYYEVFNSRQLIAFNFLIESISAIPEEEYRNAFLTMFSNSLEYNNMMTPYNYPHRKIHHLFNYHAMPLTTMPVENAVWGVSDEGAGTFVNCYGRYVRAKQYCEKPFDKFKDSRGEIKTIYSEREKISAKFVSSFDELKQTSRSALLFCGDSSRLPAIPDASVDFVITDPPYFDNIHYSELSNFFYVWLSQIVDHPYFAAEHVPTEQEAIVNSGMDKGDEDYRRLLTSVFKEGERVLKDTGSMIFTFHHTKWQAWWTLLSAVADSGFYLADSFPVMSEYKVNPHVRNKQALDMDLVLICRKRSTHRKRDLVSINEIAQQALNDLVDQKVNGSKNKLFLYFVSELLKAASLAWGKPEVTYTWFVEMLSRFETFTLQTLNEYKEKNRALDAEQLRLLWEVVDAIPLEDKTIKAIKYPKRKKSRSKSTD